MKKEAKMRNAEDIIIAAKIEVSYGTDAAPTGADAILALEAQIEQGVGNEKEKKAATGTVGNSEKYMTGLQNKVSFKIQIAGSGTAGSAPKYGCLLRACGFSETIAVGASVTYLPITKNLESITLYYEHDGDVHKLTGARGSVSFHFPKNDEPYMQFNFIGLYSPVTAGVIANPDFSGFRDALEVNFNNTNIFNFFGKDVVLQNLEVNMDRKPELRDLPNQKSINANDKSPTGSITFDSMKVATFNFFNTSIEGNKGALNLIHGDVAGDIIEFKIPKTQFLGAAYAKDNNVSSMTGNLWILPDQGDDDVKLIFK